MIADQILSRLSAGKPVGGRHVVVVAHPDDEAISFGGALCCLSDVVIVQLTEDTIEREAEREAAQLAGGWEIPVFFGGCGFRQAYRHAIRHLTLVAATLHGADVIWTHPYEGGHLDHDTAAWLVQTACPPTCLRMEFASYHVGIGRRQVFGDFWPDAQHPTISRVLSPEHFARKLAAIAAYGSQQKILRKFPNPGRELYRTTPHYDFTMPPPPPIARWDMKRYEPSTESWRAAIAAQQVTA